MAVGQELKMDRVFVMIGGITMFLGVALGAFGAHGLSGYFERFPDLAQTFDTGVRYHMIHGLALFVAAWVWQRWAGPLASLAGYLFLAGIILFSGSLYLLVATRARWLGAVTPLGGVAFLSGWICLLIAAWRN
jgi:uncharacterized membrane protein YgdD (TMEM256/DUF423 family)